MKPDSQNARVLAVLSDGLPHSAAAIHREAGFSRLNSRIAELRSKLGLQIVCEHVGGTGPDAFVYTLLTIDEGIPQPAFGASAVAQGPDGSSRLGLAQASPIPPSVAPATVTPLESAAVAGAQLDLFGAAA
jgi:hypothetical protein